VTYSELKNNQALVGSACAEVRAHSNVFSLPFKDLIGMVDSDGLSSVEAASPSAAFAAAASDAAIEFMNLNRIMKNRLILFDVIKAQPKFISHQRNPILR
jgi:hypothetical protein